MVPVYNGNLPLAENYFSPKHLVWRTKNITCNMPAMKKQFCLLTSHHRQVSSYLYTGLHGVTFRMTVIFISTNVGMWGSPTWQILGCVNSSNICDTICWYKHKIWTQIYGPKFTIDVNESTLNEDCHHRLRLLCAWWIPMSVNKVSWELCIVNLLPLSTSLWSILKACNALPSCSLRHIHEYNHMKYGSDCGDNTCVSSSKIKPVILS